MAELLIELLEAGLMEKLDGNDTRLGYIEKAAKSVGEVFVKEPEQLIGAILAGLDPDISPNDPSIMHAKDALNAEWKTMGTVYTSPPIGLYRSILLVGCHHAALAATDNAAIVWLTAADTFPLMRPGKEEAAIRKLLEDLATRTEEAACTMPKPQSDLNGHTAIKVDAPNTTTAGSAYAANRDELHLKVIASTARQRRDGQQIQGANRYWPHDNGPNWCWDFAERMHTVLADELDTLANEMANAIGREVNTSQKAFATVLTNVLVAQRTWVESTLQASDTRSTAEQMRLDALWWSEAMYSSSLRRSYRKLPAHLAAVVMAADLLHVIPMPAPASVGHLLAETVNRLPNASFERKHPLIALLSDLRKTRDMLPADWMERFCEAPDEGRLSLRDLVVLALGKQGFDIVQAIPRTGLPADIELDLPDLAHAIYRQDQAVELARREQ
jgi:GTPase-associated system helical domain